MLWWYRAVVKTALKVTDYRNCVESSTFIRIDRGVIDFELSQSSVNKPIEFMYSSYNRGLRTIRKASSLFCCCCCCPCFLSCNGVLQSRFTSVLRVSNIPFAFSTRLIVDFGGTVASWINHRTCVIHNGEEMIQQSRTSRNWVWSSRHAATQSNSLIIREQATLLIRQILTYPSITALPSVRFFFHGYYPALNRASLKATVLAFCRVNVTHMDTISKGVSVLV